MLSKGKYILLQTFLILLSPITSFLVAVRLYKSAISQFFFVIFAMYLGYYMGFVYDLMRHYLDIPMYYHGRSWHDIVYDPRVYGLGKEYFHIVLKYIFSRFTEDRQLFGAVASGLYATSFIFFLRQLKTFYKERVPLFCEMMLLCVATVVEFYWYQGLRYWFGVYIFLAFYLKYINSGKWWWLCFTPIVMMIHFSLSTLVMALLLNAFLNFTGRISRFVLLGLSLFVKSLNVDFVPYMLYYLPWTQALGMAYTDENVRNKTLDRMATVRMSGNTLYVNRSHVLIFIGLFFLFVFRYCKGKFDPKYRNLFYFAMTLYTIASFGYGDMIFYGRFLKVGVLVFYTYVYIIAVQTWRNWNKYNIFLFLIAGIPFAYSFFMAFVQLRNFFFYPELIFGNFLIDWDGNALNMKYDWK